MEQVFCKSIAIYVNTLPRYRVVATGALHPRLDITGAPGTSMWWKFAFTFMTVTFIVSVFKHGLAYSAYTYFVDEL